MAVPLKGFLGGFALLGLFAAALACAQRGAEAGQEEIPVQERPIEQVLQDHTDSLMALPGVVGTAQGKCDGEPCIKVLVVEKTPELLAQIPSTLERYTVEIQETGEIEAFDSS